MRSLDEAIKILDSVKRWVVSGEEISTGTVKYLQKNGNRRRMVYRESDATLFITEAAAQSEVSFLRSNFKYLRNVKCYSVNAPG